MWQIDAEQLMGGLQTFGEQGAMGPLGESTFKVAALPEGSVLHKNQLIHRIPRVTGLGDQ